MLLHMNVYLSSGGMQTAPLPLFPVFCSWFLQADTKLACICRKRPFLSRYDASREPFLYASACRKPQFSRIQRPVLPMYVLGLTNTQHPYISHTDGEQKITSGAAAAVDDSSEIRERKNNGPQMDKQYCHPRPLCDPHRGTVMDIDSDVPKHRPTRKMGHFPF